MPEITPTRERERGPEESDIRLYEPVIYQRSFKEVERQRHGRVVVRGKERLWDLHAAGNSKRYLSPLEPELSDTALQQWEVFVQVIPQRSGRHRHQGGLVIFILEGRGYSVFDGERLDWEAGDLLLLPVKPDGLEHQHFNLDPEHPAKWIAFLYWPMFDYVGSEITQLESSPWYEAYMRERESR